MKRRREERIGKASTQLNHKYSFQTLHFSIFLLFLRIEYRKNMKRLAILIALVATIGTAWAQTNTTNNTVTNNTPYEETETTPKKSTFWTKDKLTYGGGFGFTLNRSEFYVMIMPEIGYQLFEPWQISVAPKYSYNGDYNGYFSDHTVGVRIGTRVDFIRLKRQTSYKTNIFFALAYQYEYEWGNHHPRETNYFDAGIGIRQAVGSRSNLYVMVAWHLYDSCNNAWFGDPIPTVSVGFEI
jgi:hypothetical protein